jgi:hypothetical protein
VFYETRSQHIENGQTVFPTERLNHINFFKKGQAPREKIFNNFNLTQCGNSGPAAQYLRRISPPAAPPAA